MFTSSQVKNLIDLHLYCVKELFQKEDAFSRIL